MGYDHEHSHAKSSDCGCAKPACGKCNEVFTVQIDCCNTCGQKSCDTKSCCSSCNEGPQEVTNAELGSECSWFWASIWRNCCQQPVRVNLSRLRSFLIDDVDFSEFITTDFIDMRIKEYVDLQGFVTGSEFISLSNKVTKNCSDIASINTFIRQLVIPAPFDPAGYATENYVNTAIATALQAYYTRTQVNNLIAGLQNQIDSLTTNFNDLQAQLDACDCGGGGGTGTVFTAPTADWADVLTTECPAITTSVITNPDAVPVTFSATGNGIITVKENGNVVSSPFTPADGSTIVVEITSNTSTNEVGVVNINYDDGTNNGPIDGIQYDITCAGGGGGTGPDPDPAISFTIGHSPSSTQSEPNPAEGVTLPFTELLDTTKSAAPTLDDLRKRLSVGVSAISGGDGGPYNVDFSALTYEVSVGLGASIASVDITSEQDGVAANQLGGQTAAGSNAITLTGVTDYAHLLHFGNWAAYPSDASFTQFAPFETTHVYGGSITVTDASGNSTTLPVGNISDTWVLNDDTSGGGGEVLN